MKSLFYEALYENSLEKMKQVPKSDLHNHVGRGGNISYLSKIKGVSINPPTSIFNTLNDMQQWFDDNIKVHFSGLEGYLQRVQASFVQANEDTIKVLSMSYGISEIELLGGMTKFMTIMNEYHNRLAPNTDFYPEIVLWGSADNREIAGKLDEILNFHWFKSVDWQNDGSTSSIESVKPFFRMAKEKGLTLRAHAGEFGDSQFIRSCVEELGLDEIHHGIHAVESKELMKTLADKRILLHVCPTSNVMLGRSNSYAEHQIRTLYDNGVKVTINTDDLLIFNASASQEFLHLFNAKVLNEEELNHIRENGLNAYL
jgi:adenosine deaminase